jgi:hypothetical protein
MAFRLLDHLQDRGPTRTVAEYAHADIDFLGPRIGVAESNQGKQGIGFHGWKIGQPPGLRVGSIEHGNAIT